MCTMINTNIFRTEKNKKIFTVSHHVKEYDLDSVSDSHVLKQNTQTGALENSVGH